MPRQDVLRELFETHIQNTPQGSVVIEKTILLCGLTNAVAQALQNDSRKVYATSRFLKHLYDKKPAEEFDFLLDHLHQIVKYPDRIYRNKPGKRGGWCLVKLLANEEYLCALETGTGPEHPEVYIATAFRVRDTKYLDGYELLWSWRSDKPSS